MARLDIATGITGYMELAAQTGAPDALFELGMLYATGRDVDVDLVTAHKWFNLAAIRGLRRAVVDRCELAKDMDRIEIAEAQRQARAIFAAQCSAAARSGRVFSAPRWTRPAFPAGTPGAGGCWPAGT